MFDVCKLIFDSNLNYTAVLIIPIVPDIALGNWLTRFTVRSFGNKCKFVAFLNSALLKKFTVFHQAGKARKYS